VTDTPGTPDAPPGGAEIRRPPYGRNPTLAALGVRARQEIVQAARELFARNGYQLTTVESIGEATGRSGAAVYQYFGGKSEIFSIFLREAGDEMAALGERFPLLTDDHAGRAALQDWIGEVIGTLDRHAGTFQLWAQVQFSDPGLAALGQQNLNGFQKSLLDRLTAAGTHPPMPAITPVGILSVVQWSYFLSVARGSAVSQQRLQHALATMLHAFLFTPTRSIGGWPVTADDVDHLPSIPLGDAMGLRRPVTARGVGTVQRILLAAADRFRGTGFYGTSLSDIASTAGVSHGSVYTYWADRDALFTTLSQDAVAAVELRVQALDAALATPEGLNGWLHGWVTMLGVHGAVLFVWTHEVEAPDLTELTDQMNKDVDAAATTVIDSLARGPVADPEAMRIVVRAVLTDVPYVLSTQLGILERDAAYGFIAGLLRAGLGNSPGG
jgi:AcrR family transcriptional regulator